MHLEDQVISLNLARKLNEAKFKRQSLFLWYYENENCYGVRYMPFSPIDARIFQLFSAYSSAELLDIIPAWINIGEEHAPFNNFWLEIKKRSAKNIQYIATYVCDSMDSVEVGNPHFQLRTSVKAYDQKLSDCLAKILLQLIEKGFFKDDKMQG